MRKAIYGVKNKYGMFLKNLGMGEVGRGMGKDFFGKRGTGTGTNDGRSKECSKF